MAKDKKTVYFCQNCGYESGKWMGQCPACRKWNTFVEETVSVKQSGAGGTVRTAAAAPVRLSEIDLDAEKRILTGIGELDRVLGGGKIGRAHV